MGQFGKHFGRNFDVKKIKELLPRRYTSYGIQKKREMVEKYYKKGQMIEAFAVLYAIIEQQLIQILKLKLKLDSNSKPWTEQNLKQEWRYAQLIRVLNEFDVLADEEYQKFDLFQNGRHKAIHELPLPHLHKKVSPNNLNNSFKAGLHAYDICDSKIKQMIHELAGKIDWSRDTGSIVDYYKGILKIRKEIEAEKKHKRTITAIRASKNMQFVPFRESQ